MPRPKLRSKKRLPEHPPLSALDAWDRWAIECYQPGMYLIQGIVPIDDYLRGPRGAELIREHKATYGCRPAWAAVVLAN